MSVIDRFFRTTGYEPATPARRARLAGELLAACAELNSGFSGEIGGWGVVAGKVTTHRSIVAEDIGLPPDV